MKNIIKLSLTLLLMSICMNAIAQSKITGKINDSKGEPLIGASVVVKGTTTGAITDIDGKYSIEVPANATKLVFSFVGYASKEITVGSSTAIDIILDEGVSLDNLIVIGSRNATRTKIETPVPVDIIPVTAIVNEIGQVDLNQILTYIAPSFQSSRQTISDGSDHIDPAQLRGLGPDQVLVLINGKRRHQSALVNVNGTVNRGTVGTDLNAIPASSIERVEILRDGAAAQYGSDAIAGVINIVLKQRIGLSGNVSYGANVTSYAKNYAIKRVNSAFSNVDENQSVVDGNTAQAGVNYGIKIGEKGYLNLTGEYTSRERSNRTGTYTGQIWPSVGGVDKVDKSDSINSAKGLTRNDFDMLIGNSRVTGGGIVYNFSYPLSNGLEIYSFGGYNNKQGKAAGFYRYPNAVPAAVRSGVLAVYPNGFLPKINSNVTDVSAAVGVRGKLGDWNVDLSQTVGQNSFGYKITESVNYSQVAIQPSNFKTEFDAGSAKFGQYTTNLDIAKKHDVLQGLNTGFGAEFRVDQFGTIAGEEASYKNYSTSAGVAAGSQVFAGFLPSNECTFNRNSFAIYTDNEIDFTKNFMVGAALRFEKYSDFGNTLNYKVASRYKISDAFTIRASTSTGFRAPSQQQKYYAKTNTLFVTVSGQQVATESGTFTNDSKAAGILGIPKLKQETSKSYAIGATARLADGLDLTVDAYQIDIKDRIILTNNFSGGNNSALAAQLSAAGATSANFFTNAVDTRNRGLEAVLSYSKRFAGEQELRFMLAGTFIKNLVRDSADVVDGSTVKKPFIKATQTLISSGQVGSYFNREDESRFEVASPIDKVSFTINYKIKKFSVMLRNVRFGQVTYLDPTMNPTKPENFPANAFFDNVKQTLDQTFAPKIVTDLSLGYQITKDIGVNLGANNLFDVYQDTHTHSGNMSSGRFIYSRRVQQMGFNGRYVFARLNVTLK